MSQQPYAALFPDSDEPVLTLSLPRRMGKIPKGNYGFIELYCTDRGCDCRRMTIHIVNEKMQTKAVISMGFDPDAPYAGPYLDDLHRQSSCAGELLDHFVEMINEDPDVVAMFQRHYCQVRGQVEGKRYRGRNFPKPGSVTRRVTVPPPLDQTLHELLLADGRTAGAAAKRKVRERSLSLFVERYRRTDAREHYSDHADLQDELRRYLLEQDDFGDEMAALLVDCNAGDSDEAVEAALRVLFDSLEILRVELERRRPRSAERMERLQSALARRVFLEYGEADLCAAVSHALLQSRIELLPVLHEANDRRMMMSAEAADPGGALAAGAMTELFDSIGEMSNGSPFEALECLLQLMLLGQAEVQTALCAEMLNAESALIRDTAVLMILHPSTEVRRGVAGVLASRADCITPDSLRRLIITRNWFPEAVRQNLDRAISTARRSRINCAPLPRSLAATVYASPVDGAAAQSFQVIVPHGKGHLSCSILLKEGAGVADAFVVPLATRRDKREYETLMAREGSFIESTADYLDLRVCHALADGSALDMTPSHWLAHVAEILGKDQWKAIPFDPLATLAELKRELEASPYLSGTYRDRALRESGEWCRQHPFAHSWFEDDADVDRVIQAAFPRNKPGRGRKRGDVIDAIFSEILEKRRPAWLRRLTLCALWLRSSPQPPLPWQQLYHLAAAIADGRELAGIPLMEGIAGHTLAAHLARAADERH